MQLTGIIWREDDGYIALCPELNVASEGDSITEARANLQEALEGFFEVADADEITRRFRTDFYITRIEVSGPKRSPEE